MAESMIHADDEHLILRVLRQSRIQSEVVVTRDGAEALGFLPANGQYAAGVKGILPRLIILDLRLPKIDGLEVLKRIRGNEPTRLLPVVLTSSNAEQDRLKGCEVRANSYVKKPIDFVQFAEAVEQLGLY
jgi:two-component system, response regulator